MTGNLTRCPLCLEPVALCSCDELEREVAMAARGWSWLAEGIGGRLFACRDPEQAWIKDQQDAADG